MVFYIDNDIISNKNHCYKVTIKEFDVEEEVKELIEIFRALSTKSQIKVMEIATYLKVGEENAARNAADGKEEV